MLSAMSAEHRHVWLPYSCHWTWTVPLYDNKSPSALTNICDLRINPRTVVSKSDRSPEMDWKCHMDLIRKNLKLHFKATCEPRCTFVVQSIVFTKGTFQFRKFSKYPNTTTLTVHVQFISTSCSMISIVNIDLTDRPTSDIDRRVSVEWDQFVFIRKLVVPSKTRFGNTE